MHSDGIVYQGKEGVDKVRYRDQCRKKYEGQTFAYEAYGSGRKRSALEYVAAPRVPHPDKRYAGQSERAQPDYGRLTLMSALKVFG